MDFFRDLNSVQLAVSEYENEEIDKKTHTFYSIEVRSENGVYYVKRRFKEFELLHNKLKRKSIPDKVSFSSNVEFPSKHLYTRTTKTFENRRFTLDIYMKKIIEYYEDASKLPTELKEFIKFDVNQEPLYINKDFENDLSFDGTDGTDQPMPMIPSIGITDLKSNELVKTFLHHRQDSVLQGVIQTFY